MLYVSQRHPTVFAATERNGSDSGFEAKEDAISARGSRHDDCSKVQLHRLNIGTVPTSLLWTLEHILATSVLTLTSRGLIKMSSVSMNDHIHSAL